jgi:hypothetical protein
MPNIVTSSAQLTISGLSDNLNGYTNDTTTWFKKGSDPISGSSSFVLTSVVTAAYDGVLATAYSDIFYHRIWVIPHTTNLGNLVANVVKQIEVWNANFSPVTLNSRSVEGDDSGMALTGLSSGTFNGRFSEVYELSASLDGAPVIDYDYLFDFDTEDVRAYIVGRRVLPFTLEHNWQDTVIEQIAFKTDVMAAQSGKEQRLNLRTAPRRRLEMSYVTMDAMERASLENTLIGWHTRVYAVPLWMDSARLADAVTIGQQTFNLDTANRDYDIGDFIFIQKGTTYDILEIDAITATTVHTRTGALNAYAVGTKVAPARLGVLESKIALDRQTSIAESFRFAWSLMADNVSSNRRVPYTPTTYRGLEVYNLSNDYSDTIQIGEEMREDVLDNDTGLFQKYQIEPFPRRTYPFRELFERSEFGNFIEWAYNRDGQRVPFWWVERVPAFKIVANESTLSSEITVTNVGYTLLINAAENRRDIAIRLANGSYLYRRIVSAEDNLDGTETLTLDQTHGVNIVAADTPYVSYLKCVRLASDIVEIEYHSTNAIRTATSFTDLLTTAPD